VAATALKILVAIVGEQAAVARLAAVSAALEALEETEATALAYGTAEALAVEVAELLAPAQTAFKATSVELEVPVTHRLSQVLLSRMVVEVEVAATIFLLRTADQVALAAVVRVSATQQVVQVQTV
jgi:hypothetical protein